jgi:serine/threonine protein phosphatase PrpC
MAPPSQSDTVEIEPVSATARTDPRQPFSSLVQVDLAGATHPGKVRPNNEDHFLTARYGRFLERLDTNLPEGDILPRSEETGYGMAVADGIGGGAAGEVASRLAINTLVNVVLNTPDWILVLDDDEFMQKVVSRARERFRQLNAVLTEQGRADPSLRGFGTTLTLALSLGNDLVVAHVGDSRACLLRRGQLRKITREHTLAAALADEGVLPQQEVATHRLRHVLTRALGMEHEPMKADVHRLTLQDGDRLLMCTDGLTDMVKEERIAELLGQAESADQACRQLIDAALEAGGKDNVTVIVARYRLPQDQGG